MGIFILNAIDVFMVYLKFKYNDHPVFLFAKSGNSSVRTTS